MLDWPMPLRALIDGRDLVAPLLDETEWDDLRAEVKAKRVALSFPCCDTAAYPRVSKLGTRNVAVRRSPAPPGFSLRPWQSAADAVSAAQPFSIFPIA